jgi:hypothetical protein
VGVLDRMIQKRVDKALSGIGQAPAPGPEGASDATSAVAAIVATTNSNGNPRTDRGADALPWTDPETMFPIGVPQNPINIDPRLPQTKRPLPRKAEMDIGWNLPGQGAPAVPWSMLRDFADQVDIVRLCIGVRKKEICGTGWSIAVKGDAVSQMAQEQGKTNARARSQVTRDLQDEITRLSNFWEKPDRINRLTFGEWLGTVLEEMLVLDALSIYPHPDHKGDLHSLEILDGSTIKPLLDYRGAFPQPPQPAYQQILWGYPRGEFTLDDEGAGVYTSDQLIYRPRERRTHTPYGFPAVEQAILAGDLYMKRQQWLRAEYTDGSVPAGLLVPPDALRWSPEQVRQYEQNINMELAGNTEQRMRWRMLPPGTNPLFPQQFAEKYNSGFDEYLIKLLCAFFDVMPSEIGFVQAGGLGGAGHQEGEAASGMRKGNAPIMAWLTDLFNEINQTYLGAPKELTFQFEKGTDENLKDKAAAAKSDISSGARTLNDVRADNGEPLYDFPEADEPFIVTANGPVFLKGANEPAPTPATPAAPGVPTSEARQVPTPNASALTPSVPLSDKQNPASFDGDVQPNSAPVFSKKDLEAELRKFDTFSKRRVATGKWRDFKFTVLPAEDAERLNRLAEAELKKAQAPEKSGHEQSMRNLIAHYTERIAQATATMFPHLDHVVTQYMTARKADDPGLDHMLESEADTGDLGDVLDELWGAGYGAGQEVALAALGMETKWDVWTPGHLGASLQAEGPGLQAMLDKKAITIKSIMQTRVSELGNSLSASLAAGDNMDTTAAALRSILSSPDRAEMIATTESNRAMTTSTLDTYQSNGVERVAWLLSPGACELCQENEDQSPIALDDDWANGDPPVHPWCFCSLAPADSTTQE